MASIYNLDRLVHKGVRTKDGNDLGNVIAIDEAYITIQGKRIFKFPTQFIDLYNGSEVFLNISTDELSKYKIYWIQSIFLLLKSAYISLFIMIGFVETIMLTTFHS